MLCRGGLAGLLGGAERVALIQVPHHLLRHCKATSAAPFELSMSLGSRMSVLELLQLGWAMMVIVSIDVCFRM